MGISPRLTPPWNHFWHQFEPIVADNGSVTPEGPRTIIRRLWSLVPNGPQTRTIPTRFVQRVGAFRSVLPLATTPGRSRAAIAIGSLVAVAVGVLVARDPLAEALTLLGEAQPTPLIAATVCIAVIPFTTAAAWRSALRGTGSPLSFPISWRCYGIGTLANAILPARIGDGLRIELFARQLDRPRRRMLACGASAVVALAQSLTLGLTLAVGALVGATPLWTLGPAFALPLAVFSARAMTIRCRPEGRLARTIAATSIPRLAALRLFAWISLGATTRVVALFFLLEALDAPWPFTGALVAVGARAVGNAIPLAPGGLGVPAAAMAVGLSHFGLPTATAFAVALSFHALETTAAVLFGAAGLLILGTTPDVACAADLDGSFDSPVAIPVSAS